LVSASNSFKEKSMSAETHTESEEIVDDDVDVPVDAFLDTIGTHVPVFTLPEPPEDFKKEEKGQRMTPTTNATPKLNDGQVTDEIVNDSLGTVDPADTTNTDPKDDPESAGTGPKGNEA
jgi:hypothetical protein